MTRSDPQARLLDDALGGIGVDQEGGGGLAGVAHLHRQRDALPAVGEDLGFGGGHGVRPVLRSGRCYSSPRASLVAQG